MSARRTEHVVTLVVDTYRRLPGIRVGVARQQRDEQPGGRQQQQHGEVHAQTDIPRGDVGPLAREEEIVPVGGAVPQSRPVGQRAFGAFLAPGRGQ